MAKQPVFHIKLRDRTLCGLPWKRDYRKRSPEHKCKNCERAAAR